MTGPYQLIEDTFVELPFLLSALPELLIVVVEAGPVFTKFCKAVCVYVFDPVTHEKVSERSPKNSRALFPSIPRTVFLRVRSFPAVCHAHSSVACILVSNTPQEIATISKQHLHALRASCDPPSLFQTFNLALPRTLVLALHEVIIVRLASYPNEEACRQQRR
jgi:hypothetical protein